MSSRCVSYQIFARADGTVDIAVTTTTGLTVRRCDPADHSETSEALQDLRVILTALGRDLVQSGGPALT